MPVERKNSKIISSKGFWLWLSVLAFYAIIPLQAFAAKKECKALPELQAQYYDCSLCKVFEFIFDSVSGTSQSAYNALSGGAQGLLLAGALIWFALELLKFMASVAAVDMLEFWNNAGKQMFRCLLAGAALAAGSGFVFDYLLSPIIVGGAEFGVAVIGGSCTMSGGGSGGGAFPSDMKDAFVCLMENMYKEVAQGFVFGHGMTCMATESAATEVDFLVVEIKVPDFGMWFTGAFMYFMAFLFMLAFPFYLIDSVVRLGIVGVLMSMFVVAWAFPITKWFATQGFNMAFTSIMAFTAMALTLKINTTMIQAAIGDIGMLENALNTDNPEAVREVFDMSGGRFLLFIGAHIWAFMMIGKSSEVANHFGGMSFENRSPALAGMAIKYIKHKADRLTAPMRKAAGKAVGNAATGTAKFATRKAFNAADKLKNAVTKSKGGNGGNGGSGGGGGGKGGGGKDGKGKPPAKGKGGGKQPKSAQKMGLASRAANSMRKWANTPTSQDKIFTKVNG